MPPTLRVDWFAVLVELDRLGFPVSDVAEQIDTPRTTLLGWKQGAEPKHGDGERLLTFWSAATGKDRECLPRTEEAGSLRQWRRTERH